MRKLALLCVFSLILSACVDENNDDTSLYNAPNALEGDIFDYCEVDQDEDGFTPATGDCHDHDVDLHPGAEELCDNVDNDCDQLVDENLSQDCDTGLLGVCAAGTQTCDQGAWLACEQLVELSEEVCDGLDNDCDGEVDEGLSQECGTGLLGVCSAGLQTCQAGEWLACEQLVQASEELCDSLDNDCDGEVDQALSLECDTGLCGVCADGMQTCENGEWLVCEQLVQPSDEVWDNLDNDCDGVVDNFAQDCNTGLLGVCSTGAQLCEAGEWLVCEQLVQPSDEVCDDLDTDWDGQVDEDLFQDCDTGLLGVCMAGAQTCEAGAWLECVQLFEAMNEVCDSLDNDCDGVADDFIQDCDTGLLGVCASGVQACEVGEWLACEQMVQPTDEVCDGLDNDCDDEVDEDCVQFDADQDGFSEEMGDCDDDDSQVHPEAIEFPNEVDDDCDGEVDEEAGVEWSNGLTVSLWLNQIVLSGEEASHWTGMYVWTVRGLLDGNGDHYPRQYVRGLLDENVMIFDLPEDEAYRFFNFGSENGHWMGLAPWEDSPGPENGVVFFEDECDGQTVYSLEVDRGVNLD